MNMHGYEDGVVNDPETGSTEINTLVNMNSFSEELQRFYTGDRALVLKPCHRVIGDKSHSMLEVFSGKYILGTIHLTEPTTLLNLEKSIRQAKS